MLEPVIVWTSILLFSALAISILPERRQSSGHASSMRVPGTVERHRRESREAA